MDNVNSVNCSRQAYVIRETFSHIEGELLVVLEKLTQHNFLHSKAILNFLQDGTLHLKLPGLDKRSCEHRTVKIAFQSGEESELVHAVQVGQFDVEDEHFIATLVAQVGQDQKELQKKKSESVHSDAKTVQGEEGSTDTSCEKIKLKVVERAVILPKTENSKTRSLEAFKREEEANRNYRTKRRDDEADYKRQIRKEKEIKKRELSAHQE